MSTDKPCVLVVDDNPADIAQVEQALKSLDCRFVTLQDPHRVLRCVETEKPELVILDALLPGVSGFDLCKRIKTAPNGVATRVIILTGVYLKEQYRNEAMSQFRADEFVTKPFRPPELHRLASKLLSGAFSRSGRGRYARAGSSPGWLGRLWGRFRPESVEGLHLEPSSPSSARTEAPPEPASSEPSAPSGSSADGGAEIGPPVSDAKEVPPSRKEQTREDELSPAPSPPAEDEPVRLDLRDLPRVDLLAEASEEERQPSKEKMADSDEEQTELKRRANHVSEVLRGMAEDPDELERWESSETESTIPASVSAFHQSRPKFIDERGPRRRTSDDGEAKPVSEQPEEDGGGLKTETGRPPDIETPEPPAVEDVPLARAETESPSQDSEEEGVGRQADIAESPLPTSQPPEPEARFGNVPIYEEEDFCQELSRELSKCRRVSKPLTLIVLRIADMAEIVELLGKDFRQQVLWYVAEQAVDALREVDFAGFLRSQQLIVLTAFASDRYGGTRIIGRIRKMLDDSPFTVGEGIPSMVPALRFGLATFPEDGKDVDALLDRARTDMDA